mgnify:CR=1 FL=1
MTQLTVKTFSNQLAKQERSLQSVLPAHIPAKKFMRTVVGAVQNNPELLQADQSSVLQSCQKAAQDGLLLDNREAALVTFNTKVGDSWVKKAQYMPMMGGILKKARNSGDISSIGAHVVYDNDEFDYFIDEDGTHLKHRPLFDGDRGGLRLAYATAKLKDGTTQIEVMTREEIEQVRRVSKSGSDKKTGAPIGIWKQWPAEMWKKTVLRRLCKYLPSSADLDQVFDADNEDYDDIEEPTPAPAPQSTDHLNSVVDGMGAPTGEVIDQSPDDAI